MTIAKLLVLGCLLLSVPTLAEQYWVEDPRPPQFCLQTFNAYGPIYASGVEERTEKIASFLQWLPQCDVVHLQEVWNESQIDQFEKYLSRQYNISAPNRRTKNGIMSFVMGDIKSRETVDFRVNTEGGILDRVRVAFNVKKAYHVVRANFFGIAEDFYFMNTHLHPSSEAVRLTQILDLLHWRMRHQDAKLLLSGDFNANIQSLERKFMMLVLGVRDSMEELYGGSYPLGYCTYCTGNPLGWMLSSQTFDYIFFSNVGASPTCLKAASGQVNMRGTSRKPWSDHFGVRVEFSVEPEKRIISERLRGQRRQRTLEFLARVNSILMKQRQGEFRPYVQYVRELSMQLQSRRGAFYSYFESFR